MNEQSLPPPTATLWSRLFHTPLYDALRGRLTGSLSLKAAIAAAALPLPLADLTRTVARRTRLWRIEQVDVAHELAEHFRDGLAAGRTVEELIASFGDPRQAAQLIRRARLRCRPIFWRCWRWSVQALKPVALVVGACYLYLTIRLFAHHPDVAHNYQLDLIEPTQNVPEAQRAWPYYRRALEHLTPMPLLSEWGGWPASHAWIVLYADQLVSPEDVLTNIQIKSARQGSQDWAKVLAWIKESQAALNAARQGSARARLGFVYNDSADTTVLKSLDVEPKSLNREQTGAVIALPTPQAQAVWRLGRLLAADGRRALAARDRDAFLADVGGLIGMAEQLIGDVPRLELDLTSYTTLEQALLLIQWALADDPTWLDDANLAQWAHRIAGYAGGGMIVPRLAGERLAFHDFVQRICSDDGNKGGVITYDGLKMLEGFWKELGRPTHEQLAAAYLSAPLAGGILSRREMAERGDAVYDRVEAEFRQPLWKWPADDYQDELRRMFLHPVDRVQDAPLLILLADTRAVYCRAQWLTQQRDATLVALALVLYRRRHEAWPEKLDQLVPDFLPAVPADRLTGEPLQLRTVGGKPLICSVGLDRKAGGEPSQVASWDVARLYNLGLELREAPPMNQLTVGDWILWPAFGPHPLDLP